MHSFLGNFSSNYTPANSHVIGCSVVDYPSVLIFYSCHSDDSHNPVGNECYKQIILTDQHGKFITPRVFWWQQRKSLDVEIVFMMFDEFRRGDHF